jgi:hypothetical protein
MTQSKRDIVSELLGRPCVIDFLHKEKTYMVRYLNYQVPPPPQGKTKDEALELFIAWFEELKRSGGLGESLSPEEDLK